MSTKYKIEISLIKNDSKKILHGLLQYNDKDKTINYNFCPDSVLCDLSVFEYDTTEFDEYNIEKYIDEIVGTGYEYEKAFNNLKINKNKDTYYYPLAQLIRKQILNGNMFSIKDIEKLKIYFNINLNYSISFKSNTNLYRNNVISEFKPLQYGHCSFDEFIDKNDKKTENRYIYECKNLTEVLFSILHYLIFNGYTKTRKCNHCGKLYFYNHERSKYCLRNSPYKDFTHLDCEQAVRNILRKFSRQHKSIYNKLYGFELGKYIPGTGGNFSDELNEFMIKYAELSDKVRNFSSIDNLKEMENYLKSVYKKN